MHRSTEQQLATRAARISAKVSVDRSLLPFAAKRYKRIECVLQL